MASKINVTAALDYAAKTCTYPKVLELAEPLYPGTDWTLHKIFVVVSAILMILTIINGMIQIIFHWFNYTRPNEQRQIVRIILFPMVFGFCNFLALWRYPASPYLTQLAEFYEIFALAGMFLLLTYYVCPDPSMYESYFAHLPRVNRRGKPIHDRGSLRWFYYSWVMVFQVVPFRACCTIAYWVVNATLCPTSSARTDAELALTVIESFSTSLATIAVLNFYYRLRSELRPHRAFPQLLVFKTLVFIQFFQTPIFEGLSSISILTPTATVSYDDWSIGVPAFMTVCETFIYSILYIYPFRFTRYTLPKDFEEPKTRASPRQLPVPEAILHSLGFADVVMAFLFNNKLWALFKKEATRKDNHLPPPEEILPPVNFDVAGTGVPGAPVDRDLRKERLIPPPASFRDATRGSQSGNSISGNSTLAP